ncbi:MAG: hypothetical protein P9F75_00025 [Candidatus Contendobacter sp.]|nr:hypothetical protein [Candidatus Contendobacter sp.]
MPSARLDRQRFQTLARALEFDDPRSKEPGLAGEPVRGMTWEKPTVGARSVEVAAPGRRQGVALWSRYRLTDLRAFAVMALGVERLVWRAVE